MINCPSISDLLGRKNSTTIADHVDRCLACQAVTTMIADHTAPASEEPGCAVAELQIAAREAKLLSTTETRQLAEHLAQCPSCRSADDGESDTRQA